MKGKEIKEFPGYSITEDGEVWSYKRKKPRLLKQQVATQSKKGYLQVRLYGKNDRVLPNGKRIGKLRYIHRLVYQTYINDIPKGMSVDHIDNDTRNNNPSNLQLLTSQENSLKGALETKRFDLWDNQKEIQEEYKSGVTYEKLAKKYNCSLSTMYRVVNNFIKRKFNGQEKYFKRED